MLRFHDASDTSTPTPRRLVDSGRVTLPSRSRLLDRLIEETGGPVDMQRLTLVKAPTGYGKTATIADWLGDDSSEGFLLRWVHCSARDQQSPWEQLALALSPFSGSQPLSNSTRIDDVLHLAHGLTSSLTIVIDDYQFVTSAANDVAVAELSGASPKLTLIVIGRRVALLDGPLITATTRVRVIGAEDLRLTAGESRELTDALGVPQSPSLTSAIERADGWPLAIRAALNLGSDLLYANTEEGRVWSGAASPHGFDPLANLNAFAMGSLEIMDESSKRIVLAAAQIDSLSSTQIRELLDLDAETAVATTHSLVELGFLMPVLGGATAEYRCHRAVRTPFAEYAAGSIDLATRKELYRGRAAEIASTAQFTAFRLFCAAEDFGAAEQVLANHFSTITDEVSECTNVLRALPEAVLIAHPTLTAALLFLEMPLTGVAPSRLRFLLGVWQRGLRERLPEGLETEQGPIHIQLLCQAMVVNRVLGELESAQRIMHHIESRVLPGGGLPGVPATGDTGHGDIAATASGSMSTYFREVASTALAVGDFRRARRTLKRLRRHSERKIATPWHGFPHASTRTVSDPESGANWLLASLAELAFTDTIDGHVRRSGELLHEYDALVASSDARAPGIAWVGAEVARALLAQESKDRVLLDAAKAGLAPIEDRLEPWPIMLIAEASSVRHTRGTEFALSHLNAGLADADGLPPIPKSWREYVITFEAMLNASVGNLAQAEQLLASCPSDSPGLRLERARLAVFGGHDVEALLIAQGVGDPGATKRQRVDRRLLTAVSAWSCGRKDEAFTALAAAATLIDKYFLPAMLVSLPFDVLRDVAVAARDADVCDIVSAIDDIPEVSRAQRYEQLTEMELRTLAAITQHRNANQAAASLFITAGTVKKHLAAVYRKLNVRDRDAAILRAGQMGLLHLSCPPEG